MDKVRTLVIEDEPVVIRNKIDAGIMTLSDAELEDDDDEQD